MAAKAGTLSLMLLACLLFSPPAKAQLGTDGLVNPIRELSLPEPTPANTVADAKHLEKRCYDAALKQAYKAAQAGLKQADNSMVRSLMQDLDAALSGLDPAGRAATLTALSSTADRDAFMAALPDDLTEEQLEALRAFRERMKDTWLYQTRNNEPCKPDLRVAMVDGNPNDGNAAPGYHLHGQVLYACDCSPEQGRIKSYAIDYVVPISMMYAGEAVGAGLALTAETENTLYYVKKLACCKKDRDEEEDPRTALDEEPKTAEDLMDQAGPQNAGYGYSDDPCINGGDGCTGNVPFDGPIVTAFGGYNAENYVNSGTLSYSCVGVRGGMPVFNSAVAGLAYTYDRERDKFGDVVNSECRSEIDAFFDWFFGCGGPVQPFAGVHAGGILGSRRYRFDGPFGGTESKDNITGWRVGAYYGIQAQLTEGFSAGLSIPLVQYRSETFKADGSTAFGYKETLFFHSLNLKAPSFSATYDFNAGSAGERTRYYTPRISGFDPTAHDGIVGCGNLGYWHWLGDGQNGKSNNGRVRAGAGAMVPVLDNFLVGANVGVGYDRSRSTFDFGGFGMEETNTQRNIMVGVEAMLQAYPIELDGPVQPMFGITAEVGADFSKYNFMGYMESSTSTDTDVFYGAGLNAGLYFDVADKWGLLGTFPLIGYQNSSSGVIQYGINKPIGGLQVLYAIGGGERTVTDF